MRKRWSGIIAVFLLFFGLSLLGTWTQAATTLKSVRLSWLIAAAVLCTAGYLIFSAIWSFLALRTMDPAISTHPLRSYFRIYQISMMSIAGLVTPMNLGTDVMRSMLGKKHLQIEMRATAAASILTRECKIHMMLLLFPALVLTAGAGIDSSHGRLLLAFAGVLGLSMIFLMLRSNFTKRLAQRLKMGHLTETLHQLGRKVGWKWRIAFYLMFICGFASEWQALRICFQGLGMASDPRLTFVCFGLLYFLSRTPVLPLGIGIVETAGFAWLITQNIPSAKAGALIIVWGFLRITVPFLLSAGSFFIHHRRKRQISGTRPRLAV